MSVTLKGGDVLEMRSAISLLLIDPPHTREFG